MENNKKNDAELSGKAKKARNRLNAIGRAIRGIVDDLKNIQENLSTIIVQDVGHVNKRNKQKKRCAVEGIPERIEFKKNSLDFYIDFTLETSEGDDMPSVKGGIVYGATRPLCFADCIYEKKNNGECKLCERIVRCDGREDKPLIKFTINRHGLIKSSGELDDEWWIVQIENEETKKVTMNDNCKNLSELYYRALDHIWKDALDWTNENILP